MDLQGLDLGDYISGVRKAFYGPQLNLSEKSVFVCAQYNLGSSWVDFLLGI